MGRLLQRRAGGLAAVLAAVAVAAFVAYAYGRDGTAATRPGTVRLPPVPASTEQPERIPGRNRAGSTATARLSDPDGVSRYAPLLHPAAARTRPSPTAPVVARLRARTPEGSTNVVLLLRRVERAGRLWLQVRLPALPNNTTGWLPRAAVGGYVPVATHLVVDTTRLRATLYRRGTPIFSAPVGIGKPGTPTPHGEFYVRNKLTKFASPTYGPLAFGTSARSAVLTDWPAGGYVGIHGTNEPGLIPGRPSHGCIRLRNADILRLGRLMPPGTPLTIR